jgi:hypothetical protein
VKNFKKIDEMGNNKENETNEKKRKCEKDQAMDDLEKA